MIDLPRPLLPWAHYLSLFPHKSAILLGPLVQRLALLPGPLRAKDRAGCGEPDGFDGLDRRGSYEHLLISEWMMADEAPLEFARRASAGEHAFLRIARREPTHARISVALFDAGPNQLGTPRIAHIAALILLAQRAESVGTRFVWGIAGGPVTLHDGVTAGGVSDLLAARSPSETTDADLAAWQKEFAAMGDIDDYWLIGGKRLADLPSGNGASLMSVADRYVADQPSLDITLYDPFHNGGRPGRSRLMLDLPDERSAARLIRDPFSSHTRRVEWSGREFAPDSNLVFTSASQLAARTESGDLVLYTLPNSPRGQGGRKVLRREHGGDVSGVARIGSSIIMATIEGNVIHIERHGGVRGKFTEGEYLMESGRHPDIPERPGHAEVENSTASQRSLFSSNEKSPLMKGAIETVDGVTRLFLLSASGELIYLNGAEQTAEIVRENVHDIAFIPPHVRFLTISKGCWVVEDTGGMSHRLLRAYNMLEGFFGYGGGWENEKTGLAAIRLPDGPFVFRSMWKETQSIKPPPGSQVVGIVGLRNKWKSPGLICLGADLRTISVIGVMWNHQLPRATGPIEHIAASHFAPYIAWATERGDLFVYSLEHEAMIYQLIVGEK